MIKDSIYKRYSPEVTSPPENKLTAWWFVFDNNRLLVKGMGEKATIPCDAGLEELGLSPVRKQYLGVLEGLYCYSAEVAEGTEAPYGMEFKELRSLFGILDDDIFMLAGRALQIVAWDQTHQYCGRCGTLTETKPDERAKICPKCGLMNFPRISPAIIVAVIKESEILLAHANHFASNLYSVIAGFVEPGETFEECVKREVKEEVGIKVKNIKYFCSQPWPFPNSLMVAFTAEYDEGEIVVDGVEIGHAGWFDSSNLPTLPTSYSVARQLINWFLEQNP